MLTIAKTLQDAAEILQTAGVPNARREASSLLAFYLVKDKSFLIAHPEYELTKEDEFCFFQIVLRRADGEPLQYIMGSQEFYGLDFEVDENVLIPRPESEIIVENAIQILQTGEKPRFLEIGIGSGCISVSILHNVKNATAIGLDISDKALRTAQRNAEKLGVFDRLQLKQSDIFANITGEKFDLVVSNPPYISSLDMPNLQREVRDFEPRSALTDGKDGLSIIEIIAKNSPRFLYPKGFLLMEIGFGQSEKVRRMFSQEIWRSFKFLRDLQNIERTVLAQLA